MRDWAADRYEKMPYRRCGRSGLVLPAISLGLWQSLGETGHEDACREVCFHAFDHGVTHFDLANNYGPPAGYAETVFGKVLREMPRDELVISTKAGWTMWPGPYGDWGGRKYMSASLDQSLKRMGLDYVDIYYHHRPDPNTPLEETLEALNDIVRQGKALYVGVSQYRGPLFCQAVQTIERRGWAPLTIHQPKYSMFDRWVESDLLPHTGMWGTGVIAFCPLAQGRLTGRYLNGLPADSRLGLAGTRGQEVYQQMLADGTLDKVRRLNEVAKARGQTLAQMALTWLLRDPRVTSVLIGVSRLEQLQDNLAAATATALSPEELAAIETILANRS